MRSPRQHAILPILVLCLASSGYAQLGMFSREQRVELTRDWKGDRFPDGRPRVPDELLDRMKNVTAEEAWGVLQSAGYLNQFEGDWKVINRGERLVGRVVTAVFTLPPGDIVSTILTRKLTPWLLDFSPIGQ